MTFLAAVAILSLIAAVAITMINNGASKAPPPESLPTPTNYTPEKYDNLTMLLVINDELAKSPYSFILLRFNPSAGKIPVLLIPSHALLDDGGKRALVSEVQAKKGTAGTKMALEGSLGVSIDRYMKLSAKDFAEIADMAGGIEYNLPEDIKIITPVGEITVNSGLQILDGHKLASILCMSGDDLSKNRLASDLFSAFINNKLLNLTGEKAEGMFTRALNLSETDLSFVDIEARKRPMRFLRDLQVEPAYTVSVSGALNQAGNTFTMDKSSMQIIREAF